MVSNFWFAVRLAWWKVFNRDDTMALVLVRSGCEFDVKFARYKCSVEKGDEYRIGKKVFYVLGECVPEYWHGVRFVGLQAGNLVGSPVLGHAEAGVDRSLIEDLVEGSLVRAAQSNFKEAGAGFNMKWVYVGAVVLAVGYIIYTYVLGGKLPGGGGVLVPSPVPSPGSPVWEPVSLLVRLLGNV